MSEGFTINKAYAERYNTWRKKEELQKLKDKYGDVDEDESSSSESEEEGTEALTEQFDKDWMRTLAALKSKDPKIYQKDVKFFHENRRSSSSDEEEEEEERVKKKKDKPMYLKDYHRKVILEKGGIISDEDEKEMPATEPGYYEEQENIKKSIAAAVGSSDEDSDDDGLLTRREKTKEQEEKEDLDYMSWMKGRKKTLDTDKEVGKELEPLKNYWDNPDLDAGEKYLKNYILNRKYVEEEEDDSIPTYEELVNDEEDLSSEDDFILKQESFEKQYNFRYEEPEGAEIKSFPRNIEDSLRRKDTKRAEKRKEVKERKEREKEKKREELKQLKNLKRQEILDKIDKLKQITGNEKLGFDEKDLDDDFDPKKHDEMMQRCFDDGYYGDGDEEGEGVKPVFEDDLGEDYEDADWDGWTGEPAPSTSTDYWEGMDVEDPNFVMDADYDPSAAVEKKKNKKKKSKLAQALAADKPVFDPSEKTFEEYFDEYYKLDYEDIIDDMPCRFKYRKVAHNDYGLTVDEVLKAKDKELNAWVSLKKMTQYRTGQEEEQDIKVFATKGKNMRKKQNILHSLFESEKEEGETQSSKKGKGKKSKVTLHEDNQLHGGKHGRTDPQSSAQSHNMKRKPDWQCSERENKKQKISSSDDITSNSDVKKKDKKEKHVYVENRTTTDGEDVSAQNNTEPDSVQTEPEPVQTELQLKKKKHKKKHENAETITTGSQEETAHVKSQVSAPPESSASNTETIKKKKKKKNKKNKDNDKLKLSDERLKAYGINPKRYKYMKKDELFQLKPRTDT